MKLSTRMDAKLPLTDFSACTAVLYRLCCRQIPRIAPFYLLKRYFNFIKCTIKLFQFVNLPVNDCIIPILAFINLFGDVMKLTAWVTIASLLMYIWVFARAGKARSEHGVKAPSMDGPLAFQSALRVQTNTVEQLVIFLPLLWLSASYMGDMTAAILGAIWVVGRIIYALGYYQAPDKRSLGFGISSVAAIGLLIAAIAGLVMH